MKENIQDVILFQIEQTSKMAKKYSQREFDKLQMDITVEQWILLKIIEESAELSQKELADQSQRDPASITRTLDILEKKGMIRRAAIADNRRQYQLILTKDGKEFVSQHIDLVRTHRQRSIAGFSSKELEQLSTMLLKIQENME